MSTAPELTPEQAELISLCRAQAVTRLNPAIRTVDETLDQLVSVGFGIPEPVVNALLTLTAFGVALAANANGNACPPDAARLLGLTP